MRSGGTHLFERLLEPDLHVLPDHEVHVVEVLDDDLVVFYLVDVYDDRLDGGLDGEEDTFVF